MMSGDASSVVLKTTTKTKNEVKSTLFLNVVVRKSAVIFKLFASEDETLLIRGNPFPILNLGLDNVNPVSRINFQSKRFPSKSFHKDLHVRHFPSNVR